MPGMSGDEVARQIVSEWGEKRMKLVAVSASVLDHERQVYMESGFDEYLGKPFRFEELCACLAKLLQVEFEYEEAKMPSASPAGLDPKDVQMSEELWARLKEAAERYSVTKLEQGLAELERAGGDGPRAAAHCRTLIERGDLDAVTEFLEQVRTA
jgi:CheY-like chemotaxis protein